MPYILTNANNPMAIAEREVGTAAKIQFTKVTSCIGVVVLVNNTLTAIHLSITAADGGSFDMAAANAVINALPADFTSAMVIGQISFWEDSRNGAKAGYDALIAGLGGQLKVYNLDDGVYGADIVENAINPTYA